MINTAEGFSHADRPGDRRAFDVQHRFNFFEQFEGLAHFAVELVNEGDDRRVAHAADIDQLDRLRFDALGRINHHHGGVNGSQHAVGVFREILVARRVEQVDGVTLVLKLHDRAGHRDAALLFDFHPVRSGVARTLAALDGAGQLDGAAKEQQFFSQRGFACVRVRNDRKGSTFGDVAQNFGGEGAGAHQKIFRQQKLKGRSIPKKRLVHLLSSG